MISVPKVRRPAPNNGREETDRNLYPFTVISIIIEHKESNKVELTDKKLAQNRCGTRALPRELREKRRIINRDLIVIVSVQVN